MSCDSPIFNILLVDDDAQELSVIESILSALTQAPICVDQVFKASEAVRLLNTHNYDLVLLDNRLSENTSAEFSAPFITSAFSQAKVAIISNDIDAPYLETPDQLGVDYIVDKAKMVSFLRQTIEDAIVTTVHPNVGYARRH